MSMNADTVVDTDTDTVTYIDTDSDNTDINNDTDTESYTDTKTNTDSDNDTGTNTDTDMDTEGTWTWKRKQGPGMEIRSAGTSLPMKNVVEIFLMILSRWSKNLPSHSSFWSDHREDYFLRTLTTTGCLVYLPR